MPIYMDRHDVPETVTAEILAQLHQEDLKIEKIFGCQGMTYWFDDQRKTAFCLIKAPNKQAIQEMHNHAHGDVPNSVIEVDETLVEAFLGRISDPAKTNDGSLKIIDDDAFRVIMVLETSNYLNRVEANQFSIFTQKFHNSVSKTIAQFEGRIVKQNNNKYLVSFKSVTNAILCALKIQANFKYITPKFDVQNRILKIGIDAGSPVTHKKELFEETITLATQMCEIVNHDIVISSEIKSLYENENRNAFIDKERIYTLSPDEQKFLTDLMNYIETHWKQTEINVVDFAKALGFSKSQLYRKLTALTGKSPNTFIRDYRLNQSLKLLHEQRGNISEIAYLTGFSSLAYFSKCFKDKFNILPSTYIQQHVY
ncbi:AraC family transcriptional regulator [Flavobacteriaceae bacterium MAR_2010_72]|nr:AraC family transcriptional regulator [Flavobacteriaceae bacterium MAR_2010_72]TVZ58866.1 AraC-like DNA-binding protein [Flavobacteriaceae bacterium MAR_2010_105]